MKSEITIDSLLKKEDRLSMGLSEIWQKVNYFLLDIKKTDVEIYAVTTYDLNMFGYGESEDEAIQDLCDAIVEYYEELEDNQNCLGKVPAQHKHFLDQMIQKCN